LHLALKSRRSANGHLPPRQFTRTYYPQPGVGTRRPLTPVSAVQAFMTSGELKADKVI